VVAQPWSHSIVSEAFSAVDGQAQTNGVAQDHHHAGPAPEYKVVKTEKFHAQPLSVEGAIVQLNLMHEPFLVFCHDTDGRVAVVYKREDGSYGLIETLAALSPAPAA
jgi:putative sigma-54 modulation protein